MPYVYKKEPCPHCGVVETRAYDTETGKVICQVCGHQWEGDDV
jgi:uncharacterized Zn finger protein (UPF0148 family)